jgi:DNA-binding GntR family transcriptional regulator
LAAKGLINIREVEYHPEVCARRRSASDWTWLPPFDSGSRVDFIHGLLRDAILDGSLPPGAYLREVDIAGQTGISRSPVREAIRQLHQEGLVEIFPKQGAIVAGVSAAEVPLMYAMRRAIEAHAFERACEVATSEDHRHLTDQWTEMNAALRRGDAEAVVEGDLAFHRSVVHIACSAPVERLWGSLDSVVRATVLRFWHGQEHGPMTTLQTDVQSHLSLLEAVLTRNGARARELALAHVVPPDATRAAAQPAPREPGKRTIIGSSPESAEDLPAS